MTRGEKSLLHFPRESMRCGETLRVSGSTVELVARAVCACLGAVLGGPRGAKHADRSSPKDDRQIHVRSRRDSNGLSFASARPAAPAVRQPTEASASSLQPADCVLRMLLRVPGNSDVRLTPRNHSVMARSPAPAPRTPLRYFQLPWQAPLCGLLTGLILPDAGTACQPTGPGPHL